MARAKVEEGLTTVNEGLEKEIAYMNEKVKVRLPRDNNKYRDDKIVSINGKTYQIARGVEVEVPRCVSEVLKQSQDQDDMTAMRIEQCTSRYEKETAALG